MEPAGSLPHSQQPATCPYPEPHRSSPYLHQPISWRSILILSSHRHLVILSYAIHNWGCSSKKNSETWISWVKPGYLGMLPTKQIELSPVICSQLTNCLLAWRLAPSCLLWRCHSSALSTGTQWQHVRLLASSVTIFVVSLTFTAVSPQYHFEMLHENLPDHVSNLVDSKNYTVVASSLNNQSNNHRQSSWAASVSSVAQKNLF